MAMVTLKQVADEAGVSISTASRALNGKAVAHDTRVRVEKTAQRMGFSPNALAQGLATQKTRTFGFLVPDIANPVFSDMALGLEASLRDEDCTLILCNTDDRCDREKTYLKMLLARRVDGIVVASSAADGAEDSAVRNALLSNASCPVVLVNCEPIPGLHTILVDGEHATYIATHHLLEQGRRHVAIMRGSDSVWLSRMQMKGYCRALNDFGLGGSELSAVGDYRREAAARAFRHMITEHPYIDGVVCDNDLMAVGVLQEARARGIMIPGDMAVVGSGMTTLCELTDPMLSSVGCGNQLLGREAGHLILDVAERKRPPFTLSYEPVLVARASSVSKNAVSEPCKVEAGAPTGGDEDPGTPCDA